MDKPNQGGNNNPTNRGGNRRKFHKKKSNKETFKGECQELEGKVYYIGTASQADNYNTTTEKILSYIVRTYDHGIDVKDALVKLEDKDFEDMIPKQKETKRTTTDEEKKVIEMILKRQVDKFVDHQEKYHMNMTKAYGLILGQCTVALKNHLESQKDWEDEIEDNAINLLKAIKETCYNHQDNRYPIESIYYSMRAIFTMKQKEDESLSSFTKRFVNAKDVMETQSGKFKLESYMKTIQAYSTMSADNKKKKTDEEYDKFIALAYMKALDQKKCGKMMEDLSNQYALEQKE